MKKHKPQALLAFDFGASSGRGIIGQIREGQLEITEIHRFQNLPLQVNGHLCWDLPTLVSEIKQGVEKALHLYDVQSLAIDTWGVDYGLLDAAGQLIHLPYHYRDGDSQACFQELIKEIDEQELFMATGNQVLPMNTLFRFAQDSRVPGHQAFTQMLLMPDLLGYFLTGVALGEKTIAATSQMLNPETLDWHELVTGFGIDLATLPPLGEAGDFLGYLKDPVLPEIPVYKTFGHDTACAVASVPTLASDFLFISCGTWALAGTVTKQPYLAESVRLAGFSNEGGTRENRLLKNLTGLWLIQELQRDLAATGENYSFQELMALAEAAVDTVLIDTQAPILAEPGQMLKKIKAAMQTAGKEAPNLGEVIRCVYQSLAATFQQTFAEIVTLTQKDYPVIHVIGGGAQASFLCQAIADRCQKPVLAGPIEATAMGNLAAQAVGLRQLSSIAAFRQQLAASSAIVTYQPRSALVSTQGK